MTEPRLSSKILQTREVCLWQASLDICGSHLDKLAGLLSKKETARSRRFLKEIHQKRFIAAHGILRCILSGLLDIDPERLFFESDSRGKPHLKNNPEVSFPYFNLSHSRDMMVLGVSIKQPIGVDVEYIRTRVDIFRLAKRFFSPAEFMDIKTAPQELAKQKFYQYWTLKEAYLKATGDGISRLRDIEIMFSGNCTCRVLDRGRPMDEKWSIAPVTTPSGYAGALAVKKKDSDLMPAIDVRVFEFNNSDGHKNGKDKIVNHMAGNKQNC
jgi:4'-phosphopantetheinyl transferase